MTTCRLASLIGPPLSTRPSCRHPSEVGRKRGQVSAGVPGQISPAGSLRERRQPGVSLRATPRAPFDIKAWLRKANGAE